MKHEMSMTKKAVKCRLEYLRRELRAERISLGEIHELQTLKDHISPGDVELLEAAGGTEYEVTASKAVHAVAPWSGVEDEPTRGVFEIMSGWESHEVLHWLDTSAASHAVALFETGAKLEQQNAKLLRDRAALKAACKHALDTFGGVRPESWMIASRAEFDILTAAIEQCGGEL